MHSGNRYEDDHFEFAPEERKPEPGRPVMVAPITILCVDDDEAFQRSMAMALADYRYRGRPLRILNRQSAHTAMTVLEQSPHLALVLLDVVMETDDAGLRLVRHIRQHYRNLELRIVLVTGQPGMAPMDAALAELDISDYWLKTDLTQERLRSVLTGNLRAWEQIRALGRAKRGLQTIVEASGSLGTARGLAEFATRMLRELSRLLGVGPDGLVCFQVPAADHDLPRSRIVAADGRFAPLQMKLLSQLVEPGVQALLLRSLQERRSIETTNGPVLFFPPADGTPPAAAYVETGRPIDDTERDLLRVFASHVHTGLVNVALNRRLGRTAYVDSLLGMPNGVALQREIDRLLKHTGRRDRVLLVLDLDQYSRSCLSLGVEQGERMLRGVASRLASVFGPPCLVARLHEDTFAILGPPSQVNAQRLDELERPADPMHSPYFGVRAARLDLDAYGGTTARGAIAASLLLLKQARPQASVNVLDVEPSLQHDTGRRFDRSHGLYRALQDGSPLFVELQAQLELDTGRICGAEALARWIDDDGHQVPPSEFIPIAEASGLIVPLGLRIVRMACEAIRSIGDAGFGQMTVAVNVSPIQLSRREFAEELLSTVRHYGLAPRQVEIEITESTAMTDHQTGGQILRGLSEAGFQIAIDDFGTGYSSLSYLHGLSASTLKIDQRFVQSIGAANGDQNITDLIVLLGRRLKLSILAEGVETDEQADWLRRHGCDKAQGYLFARPESVESFVSRLRSHH